MRMDLYVWDGDFGLVSADPHCLEVLAYIQAANAPVQLHTCNNPRLSPSGVLPYLTVHEKDNSNVSVISDTAAYECRRSWMAARLPFPLGYTVPQSTQSFYRRRYIDHIDPDTRRPTPATKINTTDMSFMSRRPDSTDFAALNTTTAHMQQRDEHEEKRDMNEAEKLQVRADRCASDLATLYASSTGTYLFGDKVSTLDVVVYGLLAFASSWSIPKGDDLDLESIKKKHPNVYVMRNFAHKYPALVSLCDDIEKTYMQSESVFRQMPSSEHDDYELGHRRRTSSTSCSIDVLQEIEKSVPLYGYEERRQSESEETDGYRYQEGDLEERNKITWRKYISFGVAGAAMLLYAISSILMEAGDIGEDDDDDDDYD
eukprot:CFRG1738T1